MFTLAHDANFFTPDSNSKGLNVKIVTKNNKSYKKSQTTCGPARYWRYDNLPANHQQRKSVQNRYVNTLITNCSTKRVARHSK